MIHALALVAAMHRIPPIRIAEGAPAYAALGDSISNSPDTAGGPIWPAMVAATLPSLAYVNLAVAGQKVAFVRGTELPQVPANCALVTLEAGANDFESQPWTDFDSYGTDLRATLDVLHYQTCPTARILVLTYVNDYLTSDDRYGAFSRLNDYVRALPQGRPWVTVVDLDADSRFHPFPNADMFNVLHENGPGQYLVAQDVEAVLAAPSRTARR